MNFSIKFLVFSINGFIATINICMGQVVWTEPSFPSQLDDVTIYFDASKGNQGLKDFTGNVYAHTGVITNQSSSPTDWKNVQGTWGVEFPKTLLKKESANLYSINYNITEFYDIQTGQEVEKLAFVFRNVDGSLSGRAEDGSDIYVDVYPPNQGLLLSIDSPKEQNVLFIDDSLLVKFNTNEVAEILVENNGEVVFEGETDTYENYIHPQSVGEKSLKITAKNENEEISKSINYLVLSRNQNIGNAPAGTKDGLNDLGDRFIFQLYAPRKDFVFFLCPANEFQLDQDYLMTKTIDASRYWIELPKSLFENGGNLFQYFVNATLKIADPYSEIVLDPYNDQWVDEEILNEFPLYPTDQTDGILTVFDVDKKPYNWQVTNFNKPKKEDLVIYELLMRDFLADHSYESLLDTLDYLERLGINAIELMPINEFEGNQSWGYNPSFHMALDKYYGSRNQLKRIIDEAHSRGIAIILDVVFNHCFSQSPMAQLYWDPINFRPSEDNPWLNVTPRHPFNVGYDFNHESPLTKQWTKRVLSYWIEEFNVDGFRFDLSKGLTQTNSGDNAGLMAAYDQSRINIIMDYANHIWSLEDDIYIILEHFADNSEEKVFAEKGMMLWGNSTFQYAEAAMGYSSNLSGSDYSKRGWNQPGLIAYMESHDEERMRYKIQKWGNSNGNYNTIDYNTSMNRILAAASIFFSIPGPKMIWQFEELGYDYSINYCVNGNINDNCRLDPKPIKWNYYTELGRRHLFNRMASMIHLKTTYPTFSTDQFDFEDRSYLKKVVLRHPEMDAVTITNTNIKEEEILVDFPSNGIWYEYFSGDEIDIYSTPYGIELKPGEYRIYTSTKITPPGGFTTHVPDYSIEEFDLYPNVVKDELILNGNIHLNDRIKSVELISTQGQVLNVNFIQKQEQVEIVLPVNISPGYYAVRIKTMDSLAKGFFVKA